MRKWGTCGDISVCRILTWTGICVLEFCSLCGGAIYTSLCLSRDVRLRLRLLLLGGLSRLSRLGGSREYDLLLRSRRRVTSPVLVPNSFLSAIGVLATAVSCLRTAVGLAAAGLTFEYVTILGISSLVADADQFPGTGTADGKLGQGGFSTGP